MIYDLRRSSFTHLLGLSLGASNIASAPAFGVYVSQLLRYARACSEHRDFIERWLITRLLTLGYQITKGLSKLKKFYGRHHDFVNSYKVAIARLIYDVFATAKP